MVRILSSVIVFIVVYLLFLISGFLFPIDRNWYSALKKPSWTPSGGVIGIIWGILYGLIALSLAIVDHQVSLKMTGGLFILLWVINYVANQAFSYFEFKLKRLDLATVDTAVVALTALLLIIVTMQYSVWSSVLLIPYFLWASFATYLSWTIWRMNR